MSIQCHLTLDNHLLRGEEAETADNSDALRQPGFSVRESRVNQLLRLDVRVEVVRDKVVVAMVDDAVDQRREGARVAELAALDRIEDLLEVRVELELGVQVVVAVILDVLSQGTEEEDVLLADFTGDLNFVLAMPIVYTQGLLTSTLAPSRVPMIRPPLHHCQLCAMHRVPAKYTHLSANFMQEVPLASVPAVEICSEISEAGQMISAKLTL